MKIQKIQLPQILCVAVLCYTWFVLVCQHGEMLFTIQDFSPWLGTVDYLQQYVGHPGGLREWVGDALTQLFYYPWLGASVMVLCWSASCFSLVKANRFDGWWQLLALIPVIALLASITDLGYWMFCLKAPSYWFGPTLGLLAVSLFQCFYSRCGEHGRLLNLTLMILIGYPLLGWYATLAIFVMLFCSPWHRPLKAWLKLISVIGASLVAIAAFYYHSPTSHWREVGLLYGFHHVINPEAGSLLLEVPFWVMAISVVLLPLLSRLQKIAALVWLPEALLFAALMAGYMLNYRNANFHTELRMLQAMDGARWDEVLREIRSSEMSPTREMVIMKDVALAQKGLLGEKSFDYPIGGVRPQMNNDLPIHMAHSAAPLFYYWLGIPNFAYVWCMENHIEYGLSPFYLRMMYRCMLANGETEAAAKYKALLETTFFYKDYHVSAEEIRNVQRFMTGHDELTNDRGFCEIYLLERLSHESYDTPEAQEIAVHFSILAHDQHSFILAMKHYQELIDAQGTAKSLPKYFNQQTFDWYSGINTGTKSY